MPGSGTGTPVGSPGTNLIIPDDFNDFGGSGTFSAAELQIAISLAEADVENALSTFVTPTTVTEEYLWPHMPFLEGKILLNNGRVTSITSVTAKHSLNNDCVWIEDTQCGVILNSLDGLVQVVGCNFSLGPCNCAQGIIPDRLVITYIAGFTALESAVGTKIGTVLRAAIILRAREWLDAFSQGSGWAGFYNIASWNSMDYGERRIYAITIASSLGLGPLGSAAYILLNNLRGKPAIMLRSSGRY